MHACGNFRGTSAEVPCQATTQMPGCWWCCTAAACAVGDPQSLSMAGVDIRAKHFLKAQETCTSRMEGLHHPIGHTGTQSELALRGSHAPDAAVSREKSVGVAAISQALNQVGSMVGFGVSVSATTTTTTTTTEARATTPEQGLEKTYEELLKAAEDAKTVLINELCAPAQWFIMTLTCPKSPRFDAHCTCEECQADARDGRDSATRIANAVASIVDNIDKTVKNNYAILEHDLADYRFIAHHKLETDPVGVVCRTLVFKGNRAIQRWEKEERSNLRGAAPWL